MSEEEIKNIAVEVGFDACGIAAARPYGEELRRWEEWVRRGCHASMEYMERRVNVGEVLKGARSVIVCLMNYYPAVEQDFHEPKIAKYAYSRDYHYVMWEKLRMLAERAGLEEFAVTCDTMPVMERALAVRAGLGWIGKNNMLVNREYGSFTFIGTVITTLPLKADKPMSGHCGKCRRCLDACPTGALSERCLDANRCLSFRTIESKEELTEEEARKGWVFGCDECQTICPWNKRFAHPHRHKELEAVTLGLDITTLSNSVLRRSQSPLCRSNITKLKKNYRLCISNRQNS